MNSAHLHLAINHIPVVGVGFVTIILTVGLLRKNEYLQRVGVVGLILVAILAVPAYLTGEPAEHVAEKFAGVAKTTVEQHEEAAQVAFSVLVGAGVFGFGGLAMFRKRMLPRWFSATLLVIALGSTFLMGWTANLGGLIRHPEIASSTTSEQQGGVEHRRE